MSTSLRPAPTLWGDKRFHTWNYEMRDQFQEKVFKVMLDAGFTCPNRDGTIAKGGCTFCAPAAPVILPDDGGTILLPSSTPSVTGGTRSGRAPNTSVISKPIPTLMLR